MSAAPRQINGNPPVDVPAPTVWSWLAAKSHEAPTGSAVAVNDDGGRWIPMSWEQLAADVYSLAAGLVDQGIEAGDRVVLMAPTSYEWTRIDLAVMTAGAVLVPVYDSGSVDQCRAILRQAQPRLAFAGTTEAAATLREADPELTTQTFPPRELVRVAADADDASARALEQRIASTAADDVATIVFTSGTTGDPKGVPLTHHQLIWTARQTAHHLRDALGPEHSMLLFLPLAHIFARVVVLAALEAGVELAYARSIADVPDDLRSYRPTFLLAVPRMLDRVISRGRKKATGLRRPLFDWGIRTAQQWSATESRGPWLRCRRAIADRLVLSKVRDGLGGRVRYAVSGGARLDPDLAHAIRGTGVTVLEGYGLTETTAPVAVQTPDSSRVGTVGLPLPGVSIRLGADDEIEVRGPNVMSGYLRAEGSADPGDDGLEDGWLRTGDRGDITDDGQLRIITRIKDVIVTDGGKNVAPGPLEDALVDDPAIAQAMVVGDDRPFIAALIALDEDADTERERQRAHVQRVVDRVNTSVSTIESIREFRIIDRPFTEDRDELTPTMKLRREQILEHFADDIEALYAGHGPT